MPTLSILADDGTQLLLDQDAALPEQGFDAGIRLRQVKTMYPGASAPSRQIMGTEEEPITIKGMWRDDLLGLVGGAQANVNTARLLVLRQVPCSLTWYGDDGSAPLSRSGLVVAFTPTWRRADAVGWSLTFEVDEATESEVVAVPAVPLVDPYAFADALRLMAAIAEEVATAAVLANNVLRAVL